MKDGTGVEPIPISKIQDLKRLNLSQQLAVRVVLVELERAKGRFRQVMTECGLDPEGVYCLGPDGTIRPA